MNRKAVAFCSTTGFNLQPQHGAKSKAIVILFFTQDALDRFQSRDGWTAGTGAAAAVLKRTASGSIDIQTGSNAVVGFALTNAGVMFDASVEGTKVKRLAP